MSSRYRPFAHGLALSALCALAACKPAAAPPQADTADAANATATTPGANAAPAGNTPAASAFANPLGSAKDDILAAMRQFVEARSFHASMQISGGPRGDMTNEVDFVAPDRYRMQMATGTQYIIGDTMHMQVQGRTMQVPMPKGTLSQWRDPGKLSENADSMTVGAQGREDIDGTAARKYLVHNTQPQPLDVTLWIGPEGLPVQLSTSSLYQGKDIATTIRYSRFNDPTIRIDPPQ